MRSASRAEVGPAEIGNDIVDLSDPGARGKHLDRRFIGRVFTATERQAILASPDATLRLWSFWAAKESVFKIIRRRDPSAVFAHVLYEVDAVNPVLTHGGERFSLHWETTDRYVHCVALAFASPGSRRLPPPAVAIARLEEVDAGLDRFRGLMLDGEERESARSEPSEKARLLAKRLLKVRLGVAHPRVVRPRLSASRFGAPCVFGGPTPVPLVGLSLSHDASFVAAAAVDAR